MECAGIDVETTIVRGDFCSLSHAGVEKGNFAAHAMYHKAFSRVEEAVDSGPDDSIGNGLRKLFQLLRRLDPSGTDTEVCI